MDDVGARTYYPHPLFAVVPPRSTIAVNSRIVNASFDYRMWSGMVGEHAAVYLRRNRLSDSRIPVRNFGLGHSLAYIIPIQTYGESHPEYLAFRDGRRQPEGSHGGDATQPCFTNPDVIRLTIDAARSFFDENPDRNTFSLCVNDNPRYCECDACSALDKPYRDIAVTVGCEYGRGQGTGGAARTMLRRGRPADDRLSRHVRTVLDARAAGPVVRRPGQACARGGNGGHRAAARGRGSMVIRPGAALNLHETAPHPRSHRSARPSIG